MLDAATHANYLTQQGDSFVLESTDPANEGRKTVTVRAYLEEYPSVES